MNKINQIYDGNNFTYKSIGVYKGIKGKKLFNILNSNNKEYV